MSQQTQTLDLDALNNYLSEQPIAIGPITGCKKFSIGQSNPTFLLNTEGESLVLRRQPPGKLLKSAHQVDREFRVMHALQNTKIPVPPCLHLCTDSNIIGSQFFIMGYIQGEQYTNPALHEVDKSQRTAYYNAVIDNLAALHQLNIVEIGLEDYGKGDNFFSRQIELWTRQYRAAETETRENIERLIEKLPALLPKDNGEKTLIHGDYKFDNLIFSQDRPEIIATLDWELSTIGHPLSDLAYFCMNLRLPQNVETSKGLDGIDRNAHGIPDERDLIQRYCSQREVALIEDIDFYIAFSFFRMASICQGVYKRALSGNASNESGKLAGMFTDSLAEKGLDALKKFETLNA